MRGGFWAILFGLAVAVVAVVGWTWRARHYEERFEDEVDRLRATGAPVEPAEFVAPPVPDEKNAAVLLLEAREKYEAGEDEWPYSEVNALRNSLAGRRRLSADEVEEHWIKVEAWIDRISSYLAMFRRAAARPACRFEVRWSGTNSPVLEPLWFVGEAAEALEWSARVRLRRGARASELFADCEAAWRICNFVPAASLGNCLARGMCQSRLTSAMELFARSGAPSEARTRFEPLLAAAEDPASWVRSAEAERVALIRFIRYLSTRTGVEGLSRSLDRFDAHGRRSPGKWKRIVSRPQLFRDGLETLRWYSRAIDLIRSEPDSSLAKVQANYSASDAGGPFRGFLRAWENNVILALRNRQFLLARLRLTRLGLAALAFREETARWPASLSELEPMFPDGIPLQPGSELPFEYEPGVRIVAGGSGIQEVAFKLQ